MPLQLQGSVCSETRGQLGRNMQLAGDSGTAALTWAGASFWKGNLTWIKVGTLYLPRQHLGWTFFSFEDRSKAPR